MGTFTIDITPIIPDYTGVNNVIINENCITQTLTYNIGVANAIITATKKYLIENYTGVQWKNLHISNIDYSDASSFYLENSAVPLPQAGGVVLDISTIGIDDVIPGFNIIQVINRGDLSVEKITFSLAIEDTNLLVYPNITVYIDGAILTCSTPLEVEASAISTVAGTECTNPGSTQTYFSVTSTLGEDVNFKYNVTNNGNHGFDGGLYRLVSSGGAIDYLVSGFGNSEGVTYNLIDNMGPDSTIHYMTYICAKPNLIPSVANSCALQLDLRNNANTAIIQSFNLTDSNSDI